MCGKCFPIHNRLLADSQTIRFEPTRQPGQQSASSRFSIAYIAFDFLVWRTTNVVWVPISQPNNNNRSSLRLHFRSICTPLPSIPAAL